MEGTNKKAKAFLDYARVRIRLMKRRPRTWAESRLHWPLEDHYESDKEAVPPSTAIEQWTPPGSEFTFHMKLEGTYYVLWSSNRRGLTNYIVDGLRSDPVEHEP